MIQEITIKLINKSKTELISKSFSENLTYKISKLIEEELKERGFKTKLILGQPKIKIITSCEK